MHRKDAVVIDKNDVERVFDCERFANGHVERRCRMKFYRMLQAEHGVRQLDLDNVIVLTTGASC